MFNNKTLLPYEEWNIDFSEITVGTRVGIGKYCITCYNYQPCVFYDLHCAIHFDLYCCCVNWVQVEICDYEWDWISALLIWVEL